MGIHAIQFNVIINKVKCFPFVSRLFFSVFPSVHFNFQPPNLWNIVKVCNIAWSLLTVHRHPLVWSISLHSHSSSSSSSSWTTKMLLRLATTAKLPDQNCYSAIYINKIVALNILMVYGLMRGWKVCHVTSSSEQSFPGQREEEIQEEGIYTAIK